MPREWLIPLTQRGVSSRDHVGFLFREGNIHVSDNHRVAMWCWLRHLSNEERVTLIHIDRHSDTLRSHLSRCLEVLPPLETLSLPDYLGATWDCNGSPMTAVHWGNYLSIFLARHGNQIAQLYWCQHPPTGDPPDFAHEDVEPHELPPCLEACAQRAGPVILNLDLDFFMWRRQRNDYYQLYSDDYLRHLGESIAALRASGSLKCLTIALSPECCGGWANSERLLAKLSDSIGMDLRL